MTKEIEVDDWLQDDYGWFRVMAIAEGWMMVRRKGAVPFTIRVKDKRIRIPDENRQTKS